MSQSKKYDWSEISQIPNIPGIYAWYYAPEITKFDLKKAIESIAESKCSEKQNEARKTIRNFLQENLFKFFQKDSYYASIKGALKPVYRGELEHIQNLSDSLIERILENPHRLSTIKTVIEKSAPNFSSPLYIGMSEKLRDRLMTHKMMIERYRARNFIENIDDKNEGDSDKNFAYRICQRGFIPTRLFVMIQKIEKTDQHFVDIENILNRIYYPLLGRN